MRKTISSEALARALNLRDLSDPDQGPHAMQLILASIVSALEREWRCEVQWHRASPIVTIADNYDSLGYPPDGAARDERYTRYVTQSTLLRTQTSAMIPPILRSLTSTDVLLACPGLVYRRDCIDKLHTGEPHQVDLWMLSPQPRSLSRMIELVVKAALPGRRWRTTPAAHPYTLEGRQIDVSDGESWVEIGECGLANPALQLRGLHGLAMGLGLDRLVMLRKGIPDIRLLRTSDQLLDLAPWKPESKMPGVVRDLSLAVEPTTDLSPESLGDRARDALGAAAELVESLELLTLTPSSDLPDVALARIGMRPGQLNVLMRLTLRAMDRTLTHAECNDVRDDVYAALHEGARWVWAGQRRRGT
jgi:phenylalanyl-tRNA synthetase alpha chain